MVYFNANPSLNPDPTLTLGFLTRQHCWNVRPVFYNTAEKPNLDECSIAIMVFSIDVRIMQQQLTHNIQLSLLYMHKHSSNQCQHIIQYL